MMSVSVSGVTDGLCLSLQPPEAGQGARSPGPPFDKIPSHPGRPGSGHGPLDTQPEGAAWEGPPIAPGRQAGQYVPGPVSRGRDRGYRPRCICTKRPTGKR